MKIKVNIIIVSALLLCSCSDIGFVLKMNNSIIDKYKSEGKFSYYGEKLVSIGTDLLLYIGFLTLKD